ncbi:MAG: PfkB family carbohydrate kinase [Devosia sp.]
MTFLVLGNVAIDESMAAPAWPHPGATVLVGQPGRDLGGKGANQALVLARAGALVRFVATIGSDDAGRWIGVALATEGLDTTGLVTLPGASDRSLIFVAPSGENAIASTSHCSDALTPAHAEAALAEAASGDVLITQGGLNAETTAAAFAAARRKGMTIVFNPSALRDGFDRLTGLADLLVLNHLEARQLAGDAPPPDLARTLRSRGTRTVLITLGAGGALADGPDGTHHVDAVPAEVVDTTGAGDCYLATLAAALHHHCMPLQSAMRAAAAAASITVTRRGTRAAFPTAAELARILG